MSSSKVFLIMAVLSYWIGVFSRHMAYMDAFVHADLLFATFFLIADLIGWLRPEKDKNDALLRKTTPR